MAPTIPDQRPLLRILYRGPLASCNYSCWYCPFAKQNDTAADHRADELALARFVAWAGGQAKEWRLGIFFTPWGEALHLRRYQYAFQLLTRMSHVERVAIQTNLSCRWEWLDNCIADKVALWATYHPQEVELKTFIRQVHYARAAGARLSVGAVGLRENQQAIETLRTSLPDEIYVWINAYKRVSDYYTLDLQAAYTAIDPLFPINMSRHPSLGQYCHAGEHVISVDGHGTMRRCHFIDQPIGNIYEMNWADALKPRNCTNETCGCHIGYVHMPALGLIDKFGDGILERILPDWPPSDSHQQRLTGTHSDPRVELHRRRRHAIKLNVLNHSR
ncbi:MAG TPA: STM4011 family radical SAM protein [Anaerolineae bacterium]|nr:STM4011 family radical SAM protein [Anaerolineae bacterium]